MLNQNLLFEISLSQDSEEVPVEQLDSGSSPTHQKSSKEQDICSGSSSKPQSPPKSSFGVMNVMTTGTTSLEEQVAIFVKFVETLAASIREKDEQIAFLMDRMATFTGKKSIDSSENNQSNPQNDVKNSNIEDAIELE